MIGAKLLKVQGQSIQLKSLENRIVDQLKQQGKLMSNTSVYLLKMDIMQARLDETQFAESKFESIVADRF